MRRQHSALFAVAATLFAVLMIAGVSRAQTSTYRILHTFAGGTDGEYPTTSLLLDSAGHLYGATGGGGSGCSPYGCGTAFQLSQQGGHWNERVLVDFSSANNSSSVGSLVFDSAANIYGAQYQGGDPACDCGTIYELTKIAGVWTQIILHTFVGGASDGQNPGTGLIRDEAGNLFGTTELGGAYRAGTLFELSPAGDGSWTFNIIYSFGLGEDASVPYGPLTMDKSGNIYGTGGGGGLEQWGAAFELSPSAGAWTEKVLYNFTLDYGSPQGPDGIVSDGAGNLYGETFAGGEYSLGTIYKLTPSFGFWNRTVLYTFTGNNDGWYPYSGLVIDKAGNLYGATRFGGLGGQGTVFKLASAQGGRRKFEVLHGFNGSDGQQPDSGVVLDRSGNVYGVTDSGGTYGFGVAFEIVL